MKRQSNKRTFATDGIALKKLFKLLKFSKTDWPLKFSEYSTIRQSSYPNRGISLKTLAVFLEEVLKHAAEVPAVRTHEVRALLKQVVAPIPQAMSDSLPSLGETFHPSEPSDEETELSEAFGAIDEQLRAQAVARSLRPEVAVGVLREMLRRVERESIDAANILTEVGEAWFRARYFDQAVIAFEEVLVLQPTDEHAKLNVARALLSASRGDQGKDWARARELLNNVVEPSSSLWPHWQFWLGVSHYRHPQSDERDRLKSSANAFRRSMRGFRRANMQVNRVAAASNLGVVLFHEQCTKSQRYARMLFAASLKFLNKDDHPFEYGLAKKRSGNAWLLDTVNDSQERRKRVELAMESYREAISVYNGPQFGRERAQLMYTLADAYVQLAKLERRGANAQMEAFNHATDLCREALRELSIKDGEDWANAHFNLAESYFHRPARSIGQLERAVEAYREALFGYDCEHLSSHLPEANEALDAAKLALQAFH